MLVLLFSGWFQCRLATERDKSDEKQGKAGWTFAHGESDFDRFIRFHDPVEPRSHGPTVGVTVKKVSLNGAAMSGHPLVGARVDLLDQPRFDAQFGEDSEEAEPIIPFHLRIEQGDVMIRGDAVDGEAKPDRRITQPAWVRDYAGINVAKAGGAQEFRAERRRALVAELQGTRNPARERILRQRIDQFEMDADPNNARIVHLSSVQDWDFELRIRRRVTDPGGRIGARINESVPWTIQFRMGAWDADALCGFVRGTLSLPVR